MMRNLVAILILIVGLIPTCSFAAKNDMDLYLLIGQSNMAGRGVLTAANRISADRVFKLDASGRWKRAEEPIHFDKKLAGAEISREQTLWRKLSKKVVREKLSDFKQCAEATLPPQSSF